MATQRQQLNQQTVGEVTVSRRYAEYLVSILSGNILYLFVEPQLPDFLRHHMFRIDVGLAIDFAICVGVYGIVRLFRGNGAVQEV